MYKKLALREKSLISLLDIFFYIARAKSQIGLCATTEMYSTGNSIYDRIELDSLTVGEEVETAIRKRIADPNEKFQTRITVPNVR